MKRRKIRWLLLPPCRETKTLSWTLKLMYGYHTQNDPWISMQLFNLPYFLIKYQISLHRDVFTVPIVVVLMCKLWNPYFSWAKDKSKWRIKNNQHHPLPTIRVGSFSTPNLEFSKHHLLLPSFSSSHQDGSLPNQSCMFCCAWWNRFNLFV